MGTPIYFFDGLLPLFFPFGLGLFFFVDAAREAVFGTVAFLAEPFGAAGNFLAAAFFTPAFFPGDFSGADFSAADFRGTDLSAVDFPAVGCFDEPLLPKALAQPSAYFPVDPTRTIVISQNLSFTLNTGGNQPANMKSGCSAVQQRSMW
jgi:hypothetical protein